MYTGRGPVCGMITRGLGASGAFGGGGAVGCFTSTAGGAAATGGAALFAAGVGGATGTGGAGGAGTVNTGRGVAGGGTISRGFGASTGAGGDGAAALASTTGGFTATGAFAGGGVGGGTWTGTGPFLLMIAFNTSPGLEMCERSILVLIASGSGRAVAVFAVGPSVWPRKCRRTRSASSSSRELECVFFSVTPTSCRMSRIDLLLTSSSLARSLIRILLIRPLSPPLSC